MTILLVLLILVALIIVHELGHFIVAKISSVTVREFGVGYPPQALSLGTIGATEYTLNWIPFGGFVRLFGDEGENERGAGSFVDASRIKQITILFAGVAMNLVAGWALFTVAYAMGIPRATDLPASAAPSGSVQLFISDVVVGSPADIAGIKAGDQLVDIRDASGAAPAELSPLTIAQFVGTRGGKQLNVSFVHNGATSTVGVIPANGVVPSQAGRAAIGFGLVLVTSTPLPLSDAAIAAVHASKDGLITVASNVWGIIVQAFTGAFNVRDIVGPVGLVSVVGQASKSGLATLLELSGFISINLAVINLVPIPMLDGGRIVIVALEGIMRRRAPKIVIHLLNTVGIAAVLFLMIVVTYHDVARLIA